MSTVIDVSSSLGEYMLKGWILTDNICLKCRKVPLLRSPNAPIQQFCANCDGSPKSSSTQASQHSASSSIDSTSHVASRPSTPPTEVSSIPSSPTFAPLFDAETIQRRRQQSDMASAEIGRRLLKGWAMLADECPNEQCYGVPLVRPPKVGGEVNPRQECVICNSVYIDRPGGNGLQRLEPTQLPATTSVYHSAALSPARTAANALPVSVTSRTNPLDPTPLTLAPGHEQRAAASPETNLTLIQSLDNTSQTLESSMRLLTRQLAHLTGGAGVDVVAIGNTADAINKVSQALMKVKELQWSARVASS